MEEILKRIDEAVKSRPVLIFMKGTPAQPRCGFSMRASQALQQTGVEFAYINVLDSEHVLQALPHYANWPTFPQIYIGGELVGGCDIIEEHAAAGELQKLCETAISAPVESVS